MNPACNSVVLSIVVAWVVSSAVRLGLGPQPARDCCAAQSSEKPLPAFERLKGLAGSWVRLDDQGRPTEEVTHVFRVTAAGTAVEEVVYPGTAKEMVTVYFVRRGTLQLTHYCMAGNQPHMLARPEVDPNRVEFVCDGTGVESEDERHMHHAEFTFLAEDRFDTRWQLLEEGQPTQLVALSLTRQPR